MTPLTMTTEAFAIGAAGYCIFTAIRFNKAHKRLRAMMVEYSGAVLSQQQAMESAQSLSDPVQQCGGCGGYFKQSVIAECPGETCPHFAEVLAESKMS